MDQAVSAAVATKFRNAGQTCVCADRFLIHKAVVEEFVHKLSAAVKDFKVGPGMEEGTIVGPLISPSAVDGIEETVKQAIKDGAKCVIGGKPMQEVGSNFFQPTIVTNVNPKSKLWHSETFGPVVAIIEFDSEDEAIALANDSTAGLSSYFCTQNLSRVFRVARRCVSESLILLSRHFICVMLWLAK